MADSILMPKLGFDMREGVLVRWMKKEGEQIEKGEVIAEIETDKATVEVESTFSGVVRKLLANEGDAIPVGKAIALVGSSAEIIGESIGEVEKKTNYSSSHEKLIHPKSTVAGTVSVEKDNYRSSDTAKTKASPLARKMAKDAKISLNPIAGSGPGGRIVLKDVQNFIRSNQSEEGLPIKNDLPNNSSVIFPPIDENKGETITQVSKLRQAIGRRLVESKQNIPHFYVSYTYKMDALLEMRKKINELLADTNKLSINDFVLRAVALTLRKYPNLNSTINNTGIIHHPLINIGVAVTIPGGLMTVVVKNADKKSIQQISKEVKDLAVRAREGKVRPEDVDGSTFSTSNLGMYGVESFAAIINPPEAGILAIGASRELPVVEQGQIKVGNRMNCTLSVDHRISDGAESAKFLQELARYFDNPLLLLIND